ncbi:MAG: sigma 54-interacting transcriptional regulator [Syntrophobacteraceae bacterium]|nr:sigma 54-interacting transcriptional regulator [Syntrophobacteraceae bacterium]
MATTAKPPIDQNDFFREVSIRICGSLEIDKALWSCFLFVREVMPLDEMYMAVYDPRLGSMKIVAVADAKGGRNCSHDTLLPPVLRLELEGARWYPRVRNVDTNNDPICNHVARSRGWNMSSLLVNRLLLEDKYVGAFVARAEGKKRYSENHCALWGSVNETAAIALANHQKYRELSTLKDVLADEKYYLQNELKKFRRQEVVGADLGLRAIMERVRMVAPYTSPVLISGETGTGKEFIANAIHDLSPRSGEPLIKLNCGAIPESLIDSELFGHEKGAFTGACTTKRGRFERAQGGTIFLDEVSELPPAAQVRFLRVLQEKEFERVGGTVTIKGDVRVISATNCNLNDLVAKGKFREDLYFRLNVFPVCLPPLRERMDDLPVLLDHFIEKKCREMGLRHSPRLGAGMIDRLMGHDWPGNVRELENAVERAIILAKGEDLVFYDIAVRGSLSCGARAEEIEGEPLGLSEIEAAHIVKVLDKCGGRVSGKGGAAELLGVNSGTLRHRMRKLAIAFGRNYNTNPSDFQVAKLRRATQPPE